MSNEKRLIDADVLLAGVLRKKAGPANIKFTEGFNDAIGRVRSMIAKAPTVDAVEVVRCKDCRHFTSRRDCKYWGSSDLNDTDFCSYGERRTDK